MAHRTAAVSLLTLFLLQIFSQSTVLTDLPNRGIMAQPPSVPIPDWWDSGWRFRQPLSVSNSAQTQRLQDTVLVYVQVEKGHLLQADRDVRVIGPGQQEIPSSVLFERKNGSLTVGFALLFFADLPPEATTIFHVYYGNPSAPMPEYRKTTRSGVYQNPLLLLRMNQANSSLTYRGEPYLDPLTSKIRINNSPENDFGSSRGAFKRLEEISGWETRLSGNVTSTVDLAGNLVLVRAHRALSKSLEVWDLLINIGTSPVTVSLFDLLDTSPMTARGLVQGIFNPVDNIGFAQVGSTLIGNRGEDSRAPSGYDVGSPPTVYNNVKLAALSNSTLASGVVALATEWSMGTLPAGAGTVLARYLTFEADYPRLSASLKERSRRPQAMLGNEESLPSILPSVITIATDTNSTRLSIPEGGSELSYRTPASGWTPFHSGVSGGLRYVLPGLGDYDFENPRLWSVGPSSQQTGLFTVFQTASDWSEARQSHVATTRLWDNATDRALQGAISTPLIKVVGADDAKVRFDYRVSLNLNDTSSLFLGLYFDLDLDGLIDSRLYFSAENSLPAANSTFLVNDGAWHEVETTLDSVALPRDFQVSLNLFASTNGTITLGPQAKGTAELEIDNVTLTVDGTADKILSARLDPLTSNLTLTYARIGLNTRLLTSDANLTMVFSLATKLPVAVEPEGFFLIRFQDTPRRILTMDETAVVVNGVQSSLLQQILLDTTTLSTSQAIPGGNSLSIPSSSFIQLFGNDQLRDFTLSLRNTVESLRVHVRDVNNDTLPSGNLVVSDLFAGALLNLNYTDGDVSVNLTPFVYKVEIVYHNVSVASQTIVLQNSLDLTISTEVFRQGLTILDALRLGLPGAELRFLRNESLLLRAVTDSVGRVSVQLAASTVYRMRVFLGGELIIERDLNPVVNNAQIVIQSNYVPLYVKVIVGAVVVSAASIFLMVPVRRRLRRRMPSRVEGPP